MSVYVNVGGINYDNSTECMIKTIINNNTNTENFTFPHHLYVSKYKYTNVCAWACMCMWGKYVCVWGTMRRDWLHDAMERRLLALALGSASWLWLLALAPGLSTLAKRRCDEGLEHNGAKAIWRRPSRLLPLFPLSLALGLSTLATRRCDEGLEHNGAKLWVEDPSRSSLGSSPSSPIPKPTPIDNHLKGHFSCCVEKPWERDEWRDSSRVSMVLGNPLRIVNNSCTPI